MDHVNKLVLSHLQFCKHVVCLDAKSREREECKNQVHANDSHLRESTGNTVLAASIVAGRAQISQRKSC